MLAAIYGAIRTDKFTLLAMPSLSFDDEGFWIHLVREDDESMKPPSNVKTPAQYIASLPADRAKTITTVREFVNKHIPRAVMAVMSVSFFWLP